MLKGKGSMTVVIELLKHEYQIQWKSKLGQIWSDGVGQFKLDKVDQDKSELIDHCNRILH